MHVVYSLTAKQHIYEYVTRPFNNIMGNSSPKHYSDKGNESTKFWGFFFNAKIQNSTLSGVILYIRASREVMNLEVLCMNNGHEDEGKNY